MKEARTQPLPAARPSQIIQGIEFWTRASPDDPTNSELIRAVIAVEALKERYGALDGPDSWLNAFEAYQVEIERQARELYQKVGRPAIIVIFEPALQGAG